MSGFSPKIDHHRILSLDHYLLRGQTETQNTHFLFDEADQRSIAKTNTDAVDTEPAFSESDFMWHYYCSPVHTQHLFHCLVSKLEGARGLSG